MTNQLSINSKVPYIIFKKIKKSEQIRKLIQFAYEEYMWRVCVKINLNFYMYKNTKMMHWIMIFDKMVVIQSKILSLHQSHWQIIMSSA